MFNKYITILLYYKLFSRLPNVRYCTAYYNIETIIFLQYRLFIKKKKNMINQYIKVNESYRIIIPIISSHFSFSNITKYISIVIVV